MYVQGDPADDLLTARTWGVAGRGYSREFGLAGWLGTGAALVSRKVCERRTKSYANMTI